jgi:hypothetical protein
MSNAGGDPDLTPDQHRAAPVHDGGPRLIRVADLRASGEGRGVVQARLRTLRRLAVGRYADTHDLSSRDEHVLRCLARLERVGGAVASHTSAACAIGLPLRPSDLDLVHISPMAGRAGHPKSGSGFRFHRRPVRSDEILRADGVLVTDVGRTIADCARIVDADWAVVIADAALHRGLISAHDLAVHCEGTRHVTGSGRVRALPDRTSPRSESPGESLLRLRLARLGFDASEQVVLDDVPGRPRVDFLVDGLLVVEFDGRSKYLMSGDQERAHWEEKLRRDRIVEAGYEVPRVTWAQLWDEPDLGRRVLRAVALSRTRWGRTADSRAGGPFGAA